MKKQTIKKVIINAYFGQHLMFNSAKRVWDGFLSMVILRFELESEAMEDKNEESWVCLLHATVWIEKNEESFCVIIMREDKNL